MSVVSDQSQDEPTILLETILEPNAKVDNPIMTPTQTMTPGPLFWSYHASLPAVGAMVAALERGPVDSEMVFLKLKALSISQKSGR